MGNSPRAGRGVDGLSPPLPARELKRAELVAPFIWEMAARLGTLLRRTADMVGVGAGYNSIDTGIEILVLPVGRHRKWIGRSRSMAA